MTLPMPKLKKILTPVWIAVFGVLGAMKSIDGNEVILEHFRAFPVLRYFPDNEFLFMLLVVVLGLEVSLLLLACLIIPVGSDRKLGLVCLALIPAVLVAFWLPSIWRGPNESLSKRLHQNIWVGYNPSGFDPNLNRDPSLSSIRQDLQLIKQAGFTGIVTYGSSGTLADIPELAQRSGLAVIMGVWNPADRNELLAALRQKGSVVGYSVGHDRLNF